MLNLTSSTSAITGLKLSSTTSIFFTSAIGLNLFKVLSTSSLIFTVEILILSFPLSILTRLSKSVIISFSRSISFAISVKNSWYNSSGTFSWPTKESARTFIEVIGVFNSWDTFETNCCLDSSCLAIISTIASSLPRRSYFLSFSHASK